MTKLSSIFLCFSCAVCLLSGCAASRMKTLRAELLATDKAWLRAAAEDDVDRITSYWTDDAVVYLADRLPVKGKEQLTNMVRRGRSTPGFSIRWDTFDAKIARSGDMAYTLAKYKITSPGPDGESSIQRGTSICMWRRENGRWRCTMEVHAPFGHSPVAGG